MEFTYSEHNKKRREEMSINEQPIRIYNLYKNEQGEEE